MFGWFKKKPEPIEPDPQKAAVEELAKEPAVIDDWEPKHGNWFRAKLCHCGYELPERKDSLAAVEVGPAVCPQCGHDNRWGTCIARHEWEESWSIRRDWNSIPVYYSYGRNHLPWERNKKLVRWTEDHCQVKDDTNENP